MNWWSRVPMRWRPAIEEARSLIPEPVRRLVEPTFLVGIQPSFVGLHSLGPIPAKYGATGWTWQNVAHACFAFQFGEPIIVFPRPDLYWNPVGTILHEWGHLLDEVTGFALEVPITTPYSQIDRRERVAEAFEILLKPPSGAWEDYIQAEAFSPLREVVCV